MQNNTEQESDSIVVLTYATHSQGTFECLKKSCALWGYRLEVLGWQTKWLGYGQKVQAIQSALQQLNPEQMIMFVDAFDVVMCGPPSAALNGFRRAGSPKMLLGASRALKGGETAHRVRFRDNSNAKEAARCKSSPYVWLCSGTYMGRAKDCLELLSTVQVKPGDDDQVLMTSLRDKFGDTVVQVDCRFDVFATLMPAYLNGPIRKADLISVEEEEKEEDEQQKREEQQQQQQPKSNDRSRRLVRCGVTGTRPCVVHGPAHCKLEPLLVELGLGDCVQHTPLGYKMKKVFYHAKETVLAQDTRSMLIFLSLVCLLFFVALFVYILRQYVACQKQNSKQASTAAAEAAAEAAEAEKTLTELGNDLQSK